jgi:hypothetical protein
MINIGIGIGWAKAIYSVANNIIANFKARVATYPGSIFEAGPCLDTTLEELNAIGLLDNASLVITPNAYNETKLYDVIPNTTLGDMDVVRATTATRVNSSGLISSVGVNIPRIDYTNGSCPSILVEPQRTNLLTYSEQFDNVAWTNVRGQITTNSTISPDGTTNADTFASATGQAFFPVLTRTPIFAGNTSYSSSIFAKVLGNTNIFNLSYVDNIIGYTGGGASFNLATQVITINQSPNSSVTASMQNYGNGWYRLTLKFLTIVTPTFNYLEFGISTNDVANGFALYGAQLEAGSYATSYIPTVASAVTRNADVISKTGISSLIGQTEGTVYVEGKFNDISVAFKRLLFISDSGVTNTIQLRSGANASSLQVVFSKNGATQVLSSTSIVPFTNMNKIAVRYSLNNVKLFINGAFVLQDTSCEIPINLSNFSVSDETTIKTEILFQTALTDAECIALTTL